MAVLCEPVGDEAAPRSCTEADEGDEAVEDVRRVPVAAGTRLLDDKFSLLPHGLMLVVEASVAPPPPPPPPPASLVDEADGDVLLLAAAVAVAVAAAVSLPYMIV